MAPRRERVGRGVPAVELADDRDQGGARRPDGERRPARAVLLHDVRPEPLVRPVVTPLRQEMQVEIAQERHRATFLPEARDPGHYM